jgi:hypothetical protein
MASTGTAVPVMLQSLVDGFRIVVSEQRLTDAEWDEQVQIALDWVPQTKAVIVVTEGSGLTSKQRSVYARYQALLAQPTAVLSSAALVRGIVTAMSWLGGNHRAFAPEKIDQAFDYMKVGASSRPRILREIEALQARLRAAAPGGMGDVG